VYGELKEVADSYVIPNAPDYAIELTNVNAIVQLLRTKIITNNQARSLSQFHQQLSTITLNQPE
jgi:hypothetical protein